MLSVTRGCFKWGKQGYCKAEGTHPAVWWNRVLVGWLCQLEKWSATNISLSKPTVGRVTVFSRVQSGCHKGSLVVLEHPRSRGFIWCTLLISTTVTSVERGWVRNAPSPSSSGQSSGIWSYGYYLCILLDRGRDWATEWPEIGSSFSF